MATNITPKKYKLTPRRKAAITAYLTGKIGAREAAKYFNVDHTRMYNIVTSVMRKAVIEGKIDLDKVLKD